MRKFNVSESTANALEKQQSNSGITLVVNLVVFGLIVAVRAITEADANDTMDENQESTSTE